MERIFRYESQSVGEGPWCAKVDVVIDVTPWSRTRFKWEIEELWLVEQEPKAQLSSPRAEREKNWVRELDWHELPQKEQDELLSLAEGEVERAMQDWEPEGGEYEPEY